MEKWMKVLEFACSQPQAQYLTREAIIEAVYKKMMEHFPKEKVTWDKCKSLSLMAAAE